MTLLLALLTWFLSLFGVRVAFANGCAWRAVYVYRHMVDPRACVKYAINRKIFHLGIDPSYDSRMRAFGSWFGHEWAFYIQSPVTFADTRTHRNMTPVYQVFNRLRRGLDGRYGWLRGVC